MSLCSDAPGYEPPLSKESTTRSTVVRISSEDSNRSEDIRRLFKGSRAKLGTTIIVPKGEGSPKQEELVEGRLSYSAAELIGIGRAYHSRIGPGQRPRRFDRILEEFMGTDLPKGTARKDPTLKLTLGNANWRYPTPSEVAHSASLLTKPNFDPAIVDFAPAPTPAPALAPFPSLNPAATSFAPASIPSMASTWPPSGSSATTRASEEGFPEDLDDTTDLGLGYLSQQTGIPRHKLKKMVRTLQYQTRLVKEGKTLRKDGGDPSKSSTKLKDIKNEVEGEREKDIKNRPTPTTVGPAIQSQDEFLPPLPFTTIGWATPQHLASLTGSSPPGAMAEHLARLTALTHPELYPNMHLPIQPYPEMRENLDNIETIREQQRMIAAHIASLSRQLSKGNSQARPPIPSFEPPPQPPMYSTIPPLFDSTVDPMFCTFPGKIGRRDLDHQPHLLPTITESLPSISLSRSDTLHFCSLEASNPPLLGKEIQICDDSNRKYGSEIPSTHAQKNKSGRGKIVDWDKIGHSRNSAAKPSVTAMNIPLGSSEVAESSFNSDSMRDSSQNFESWTIISKPDSRKSRSKTSLSEGSIATSTTRTPSEGYQRTSKSRSTRASESTESTLPSIPEDSSNDTEETFRDLLEMHLKRLQTLEQGLEEHSHLLMTQAKALALRADVISKERRKLGKGFDRLQKN
ncbi:MAG: hypothetical protein M1834_002907 [Cirrosporium novae-zelandiae]|nr:MAG: hypothetical protein M1834_002907 [Cirrosporium novae-zelandiae]